MAQQLRALAALPEALGSIPRTHMMASQPSVTSISGDPTSSSAPGAHTEHRQTNRQNVHTYKIILTKLRRSKRERTGGRAGTRRKGDRLGTGSNWLSFLLRVFSSEALVRCADHLFLKS